MKRIDLYIITVVMFCGLTMMGCGTSGVASQPIVNDAASMEVEKEPEKEETMSATPEPTPEANQESCTPEKEQIVESDSKEEESTDKIPAGTQSFARQTIYEEDGVVLTFEGISPDYSIMNVKLENNNSGNKKVSLDELTYSIDGVWDEEYGGDAGVFDLLAGETKEFELDIANTYAERNRIYSLLGAKDLPIEMASFFFKLRIGTDADREYLCCPIYFDDYVEGDLEQYYGEKVDTLPVRTDPSDEKYCDLYVKTVGNKAIVVFANQHGKLDFAPLGGEWIVNGKVDNGSGVGTLVVGEGFIGVDYYEITPNYRVQHEIPNDEPISVDIELEIFLDEYNYHVSDIE